ncbi:MAG: ABC transporter permease [Dongiaceae bacterium]
MAISHRESNMPSRAPGPPGRGGLAAHNLLTRTNRRNRPLPSLTANWPAVAIATVIGLFGMFYFIPIVRLMSYGFVEPEVGFTVAPILRVFESEFYTLVILNTLRISAIVTVLCVVLSYPVSYLLLTATGNTFRIILICVMLPLWMSVVVKTYAWLVILQQKGIVNSVLTGIGVIDRPLSLVFGDFAVIIGSVHMMMPFTILPIYATLRRIDPSLYKAAIGLGARPARAFMHVILPLSLPGIAAGALIVFVLELGFFVTPAVLGGGRVLMIAPIIQKQVDALGNWGVAAVLSMVLLTITVLFVTISDRLLRTSGGAR